MLTRLSNASSLSTHEPHYDVIGVVIAGTAATMLTLLAMLGGSGATTAYSRMLFDIQLWVVEAALTVGIIALIVRKEHHKKALSHIAAAILIVATFLLAYGAALPI